jgi:3-deoxy-manno-octulosonate cytidylyltransferase (CMP-KDO synthetase)
MRGSNQFRTVAIIPARYGSQRLPAKPLVEIAGKPMIQHVYERATRAKLVDSVLVATDDERIASAVRTFGGNALMTPASLQTGTDRTAFVTRTIPEADVVVNVQGDEPLIESQMIDEAIQPMLENSQITAATLVRRIEKETELTNLNVVKVVLDSSGYCLYFSRSVIPFVQGLPRASWLRHHQYFKHIGLYVFRREFLLKYTEMKPTPLETSEKLEQLRILENGYKIKSIVTSCNSTPVDTLEDLENVRALLGGNQ